MPLGIQKYSAGTGVILPEEDSSTSRAHLTFYSDINSVEGAYHYLVFISVGNTA